MKKLEKIIKAFGNARRLAILQYLKKNKVASVTEIADKTKASYKSTSKHLAILYQADILDRRQVSYEMHYSISDTLDQETTHLLKLV